MDLLLRLRVIARVLGGVLVAAFRGDHIVRTRLITFLGLAAIVLAVAGCSSGDTILLLQGNRAEAAKEFQGFFAPSHESDADSCANHNLPDGPDFWMRCGNSGGCRAYADMCVDPNRLMTIAYPTSMAMDVSELAAAGDAVAQYMHDHPCQGPPAPTDRRWITAVDTIAHDLGVRAPPDSLVTMQGSWCSGLP